MQDNRYSLNRTFGVAIGAIALMTLIGSGSAILTRSWVREATDSRYRSTQILSALDGFRHAMLNQETGVRGYLLTGRAGSLEPYRTGRLAMDRAVGDLKRLIRSDPEQISSLMAAERAARRWQASVAETAVRQMANPSARERARAIEITGGGKTLFDQVRDRLAIVEKRERASLTAQNAALARAQRIADLVMWTALAATLLLCAGIALAINRFITRPLVALATAMRRLVQRDMSTQVPNVRQRNEVGAMARAVEVFKHSLIELDRTSVLRVTADTMPAMIAYIDMQGRIGFLNEEFGRRFDLGGEDVAQIYGEPLVDLFPRHSFPGAREELPRALAGEEVSFAFQQDDGGVPRDFEGYLRPHRAANGTVHGVVALFTDVTDRKEIDRQLRHQAHDLQRSNAELEQFAYVASHDLKAPLRGIENLASWIEEDLGDVLQGEPRANMDLLKSRVRRLESLLSDLLAYSRAGRDADVVRRVDSRALVDELAALLSPPDGLRVVADPSLPTLVTAEAALSQVFQNLIGNAIKHHPDPANGLVQVKADRRDDMYEFQVSDNGAGIPDQFRERVFGMFQTLKPRDELEGSGMGLAIVRKLVERQTGQIWLGEREGGGLVVHFTWPVAMKE